MEGMEEKVHDLWVSCFIFPDYTFSFYEFLDVVYIEVITETNEKLWLSH